MIDRITEQPFCQTRVMCRFSSQILIKMNERKYDLDFYQALEVVMNGGAVKGDNFVDGIFLKLNSRGQLVTVDAGKLYLEETNVFIKGMVRQKFRSLTVMTMKELSS
jgi:hypothetical protein